MGKPICFVDLDELNNKLKKARAVICLVQDGLPKDGSEEIGWAVSAAFDYVHEAMKEIDKLVDEARK